MADKVAKKHFINATSSFLRHKECPVCGEPVIIYYLTCPKCNLSYNDLIDLNALGDWIQKRSGRKYTFSPFYTFSTIKIDGNIVGCPSTVTYTPEDQFDDILYFYLLHVYFYWAGVKIRPSLYNRFCNWFWGYFKLH